jgi:hypothetical protein
MIRRMMLRWGRRNSLLLVSLLALSRTCVLKTRQVKWVIQMSTKEVQKFEGEWVSGKMHLQGEDLQVCFESPPIIAVRRR